MLGRIKVLTQSYALNSAMSGADINGSGSTRGKWMIQLFKQQWHFSYYATTVLE